MIATPAITDEQPKTIHRVYKSEVAEVDQAKRTVTSIITTDCVDRHKEVIVAKGIALDNFRANPVVLWCHYPSVVIGKALWVKRYTKDGKSGLMAKTLFARTEKAEEVFQLYAEEFLNGWSIGANPDWSCYSQPTDAETKARPDWKTARSLYRKTELVEYSAVSIPANPEALGNEIGKAISAELRREIEQAGHWITREENREVPREPENAPKLELPPLVGRTFQQALAQVQATVARMTSPEAAKAAANESLDRLKGRV